MLNLKNVDPKNLREIALFILISILKNDNNLSETTDLIDKNITLNDPRNFHVINEIVHGVFNRKITIDYYLGLLIKKDFNKIPDIILNIMRIGIYQLIYMNNIPEFAAINESVNLSKKYGHIGTVKLTNGILRNFLRKKEELENEIKKVELKKQISINNSIPEWIVNYWLETYSETEVKNLCESLINTPDICLRTNTLKISPENLKSELLQKNIPIGESIIDESILLNEKFPISKIWGYEEGLWYVQDPGAMIVSKVLSPQENSFVIDFCSFPGGKTTHLSELMKNTGKILAIDSNEKRKDRFVENVKRLGCKNISVIIQSATQLLDIDFPADKILVDPPCSGLGVIGRKPEIKYRRSIQDVYRLSELQYEILENASKYLKTGGELVYSTCTISKIENEDVINKFLNKNKFFKLKEFSLFGKEYPGMINLFPNIHKTDGFFIAKLEKIS